MPIAQHAPELKKYVHSKEQVYYSLMVGVSVIVYFIAIQFALENVEAAAGVIAYVVMGALAVWMMHGMMVGRLRGNGVRVSARQFATVHKLVAHHAHQLGMKTIPDVFVMESGGMLNAFATRFAGRDFVVIFSDVLALAEERGEAAVGFIVGHELAHVARGHLKHRWLTLPGRMMPYLGAAYSRACEYTCDRFGAHCQPDGAVEGLLVLAAGRSLYRNVDAKEYARQVETETGFFVKRAELMSTHPNLPKRVAAILAAGAAIPTYTPMRLEAPVARVAAR
jgi:Zn-dependent protease with chaperone function